jgi:hypothetical protein
VTVIGKTPVLVPPLIRYVEAKCLVSGVTTSQGIARFSNAGIRRFYRGIVRNVAKARGHPLASGSGSARIGLPLAVSCWSSRVAILSARHVVQQIGRVARPDIIAMATRTAAKILGWGSVLRTLEAGKPRKMALDEKSNNTSASLRSRGIPHQRRA